MNSDTLKHRRTKRTTITLEADVAAYIQDAISKNKGLKEKELINNLLRFGIKTASGKRSPAFNVVGFKTEMHPKIDADTLEKLLDEI